MVSVFSQLDGVSVVSVSFLCIYIAPQTNMEFDFDALISHKEQLGLEQITGYWIRPFIRCIKSSFALFLCMS